MAVQMKIGRLLRRGTDVLPPQLLLELVKNQDKVEGVCNEIEERRKVYLETMALALARTEAAEKAEADLVKLAGQLKDARAKLEDDIAAAQKSEEAGKAELDRRGTEVDSSIMSLAITKRELDAQAKQLVAKGLEQEQRLRTWEDALDEQVVANEERDATLIKRASELDSREKRIATAASMVNAAVANVS